MGGGVVLVAAAQPILVLEHFCRYPWYDSIGPFWVCRTVELFLGCTAAGSAEQAILGIYRAYRASGFIGVQGFERRGAFSYLASKREATVLRAHGAELGDFGSFGLFGCRDLKDSFRKVGTTQVCNSNLEP